MYEWRDSIILEQEVFIEHIPCANVYGIECYNYSSSADSATPSDWLHHINAPCIEQVVSGPAAGWHKNAAGPKNMELLRIEFERIDNGDECAYW